MCICAKAFMNNAFCLIAVLHEEEQLDGRRSIRLANEQRLKEKQTSGAAMQIVNRTLLGALLAWPSNSLSWPFCLSTPIPELTCSIHSLESYVLRASWWVVWRVQVCAVGGTAAPLLQTLPRHGVKPSPNGGGEQLQTASQTQLSPIPSSEPNLNLTVSILQGLFTETSTTK